MLRYRSLGLNYLGILKPLRDGGLPEAPEPGEGGVLAVEGDGDGALAVPLLLPLEADGERAPDGVAQTLTLETKKNGFLIP